MENSVTPFKPDELAKKMQHYLNTSSPSSLADARHLLGQYSAGFNLPEQANLNLPKGFPNLQASEHIPQYVAPEGWQQRISAILAPGKSLRERLRALPFIGYGLACFSAFIRLPKTLQQQQVLNHALLERIEKVKMLEGYVQANLHHVLGQLHNQAFHTQHVLKKNFDEIEQRLQNHDYFVQNYNYLEVGKRLMQLEQIESSRKFRQISLLLQELQKQMQVQQNFAYANANLNAPTQVKNEDGNLDQFFADFEAKFRGSRSEIVQRLRAYLPYLENELQTPIEQRRHFVDVGCGRGEWLELMSEMDIPCLGVDLNTAKVEECVAQNLAAIATDAIAYLKQQEANSLGGVTGFHIIEHLPFPLLIELFDAAFHALVPGGVLIFETPNPENLIVGACNFYYDPTHLNPIVPDVAQFIAQQRGFSTAQIKRLHPFPDDYQMSGNTALDQTLNKFLFSAQDYALIARK
jgi:O-antigen chain-terminating methyltransferase